MNLRYPKYRQEMGIGFIVLFVLVGEEILLWKKMYFESNLIENTHMRSHCRATELFGHGCALGFLCNCVFEFVYFVFLCLATFVLLHSYVIVFLCLSSRVLNSDW